MSPFVAEFLLGNVAIDGIVALPLLAPMYGGGALLIRELTRRARRGWPTIIGLGVAYSVWEEAIVTQLLFNPSYHGLALSGAIVPGLGISATQMINIVTLHTVWSVAVSIALVELLFPAQRTKPWLGRFGYFCVWMLFLLGSAFISYSEFQESGFFASGWELTAGLVAVAILVLVAFILPQKRQLNSTVLSPRPWLVLVASLCSTSFFMILLFELLPGWLGVLAWAVLVLASIRLIAVWGQRPGWGDWHRWALVAGALLTYAWSSFPQQPVIGTAGSVDLFGNFVFALVGMILIFIASPAFGTLATINRIAEPSDAAEALDQPF
jgi:hypothetical protein